MLQGRQFAQFSLPYDFSDALCYSKFRHAFTNSRLYLFVITK